MSGIITNYLKTKVVEKFIDGFKEDPNDNMYVFAAKSSAWPDDNNPPVQNTTPNNLDFLTSDEMLFGKQVTNTDIVMMVPRHDWVANTRFTMYDDKKADLFDTNFFTVVDDSTEYHVFKCLDNANTVSTTKPSYESTSEDDEFYITADGYHWKYLYTITEETYDKFTTPNFIPLINNANTSANAVSGSIDVVVVEVPGTQYNSYANGFIQGIAVNGDPLVYTIESTSSSNTNFYRGCAVKIVDGTGKGQQRLVSSYSVAGSQKNIFLDQAFTTIPDLTSKYEITPNVLLVGDGQSFQGRAIVNASSNTISSVEITNRGYGYNWATATVVANTGLVSVANTNIEANNASLRVIISPQGGHGSNTAFELGVSTVGISATFDESEANTIPYTTDFRTIGVLEQTLFANVTLTLTSIVGIFNPLETVRNQLGATGVVSNYSDGTGVLSLTSAPGRFNTSDVVTGITSNAHGTISGISVGGSVKTQTTFDQRLRIGITLLGATQFAVGEKITQTATGATAVVNQANSTLLAVTNVRGTFNTADISSSAIITAPSGAVANTTALFQPDLVKNSGKVVYVENYTPIERSANTSETVKIVIGF